MRKIQFRYFLILFIYLFSVLNQGKVDTSADVFTEKTLFSKKIRCVIQDKNGHYWFGSEGEGVTRYNGKTYTTYTVKDGLCSNFVREIQEDAKGNLWFSTREGICMYNGKSFTKYPKLNSSSLLPSYVRIMKNKHKNLWFGAKGGAYRYDGQNFQFLPIPVDSADEVFFKKNPGVNLGAYSVYSVLEDKNGIVWFGTEQRGVCRYDGKKFTWLREKGLNKAAVRCIYQDRQGILWFVNNGMGVCRYDEKQLTNFTEEKGLANTEFISNMKSKMGTLARVWSVTEDHKGNIWFATIDAGLWMYNGKSIINYTAKDGLNSNTIWCIYKDKLNTLWFGTEDGGVCTFDGNNFRNFPLP